MEGLDHMQQPTAPRPDGAEDEHTRLCLSTKRLNLCIDFEHIAIWVSEEQGAVAEGMISWSGDDVYSALGQCGCTTCHLTRSDAERKLQGKCTYRQRRIVEPRTVLG